MPSNIAPVSPGMDEFLQWHFAMKTCWLLYITELDGSCFLLPDISLEYYSLGVIIVPTNLYIGCYTLAYKGNDHWLLFWIELNGIMIKMQGGSSFLGYQKFDPIVLFYVWIIRRHMGVDWSFLGNIMEGCSLSEFWVLHSSSSKLLFWWVPFAKGYPFSIFSLYWTAMSSNLSYWLMYRSWRLGICRCCKLYDARFC